MNSLNKEIAYKALQNFFLKNKPFVFFGTGASCSIDTNYGMPALENHLRTEIPKLNLSDDETKEWETVVEKLNQSQDFESAMNEAKNEMLVKKIVDITAKFLIDIDRKNIPLILSGNKNWSAIEIVSRLVKNLPETDSALFVATPNYDLLAEYSFFKNNLPYSTGFWGGVLRNLDWEQSLRQMTYTEKTLYGKSKVKTITKWKKHIRFLKVHGSLNTFCYNNTIVETDSATNLLENAERVMITPGVSKYEKLHDFRNSLLSKYDEAVEKHSAFLFLGFGFNDSQLVNNKIKEKLTSNQSPAVVITKDLNDRIKEIADKGENVWIVCKQENNDFTRIFNKRYSDWLLLDNKGLWKFDVFAKEIMGG